MYIIVVERCVAGVFSEWNDLKTYLDTKPDNIINFQILMEELSYPFYIVETVDFRFLPVQTIDKAKSIENGVIIFKIEKDYLPEFSWTDGMGVLEHTHLEEENENINWEDE